MNAVDSDSATDTPDQLTTTVGPRLIDLRSEFEAQLRAIVRLEGQLAKSLAGRDPADLHLADVLCREVAEMLKNNRDIRDVLIELSADAGIVSRAR